MIKISDQERNFWFMMKLASFSSIGICMMLRDGAAIYSYILDSTISNFKETRIEAKFSPMGKNYHFSFNGGGFCKIAIS